MTLGQGHGKVIQYISQTHIFFVLNIKGLAPMVLTWEGKVFAAVDADAADAAERTENIKSPQSPQVNAMIGG